MLVSITGVGGDKRDDDSTFVFTFHRCGNLVTQVLLNDQRIDRFHPPGGTSLPAAKADRVERPQPVLPRGHIGSQRRGVLWRRAPPARAERVQQERWIRARETRPEFAEIPGVQPAGTSHRSDRLATLRERIPFREQRGEILFQRQASRFSESRIDVAVEIADGQASSEVHGVSELRIELADLREDFIRPASPRHVRREAKSIR